MILRPTGGEFFFYVERGAVPAVSPNLETVTDTGVRLLFCSRCAHPESWAFRALFTEAA